MYTFVYRTSSPTWSSGVNAAVVAAAAFLPFRGPAARFWSLWKCGKLRGYRTSSDFVSRRTTYKIDGLTIMKEIQHSCLVALRTLLSQVCVQREKQLSKNVDSKLQAITHTHRTRNKDFNAVRCEVMDGRSSSSSWSSSSLVVVVMIMLLPYLVSIVWIRKYIHIYTYTT